MAGGRREARRARTGPMIRSPPPQPPPLPPPRAPRHHHPCLIRHVRMVATSSASILLNNVSAFHTSACGVRPISEVFWQQSPSSSWQAVAQVGKHGETFPLEIAGAHCADGCRFAVRLRDGSLVNATTAVPISAAGAEPASQEGHNGIVTGAGVSHQKLTDPNLSPLIFTPPAVRPPVHVPGARIELLIKPPLSAPTDEAAQPVVEAMLTQLNDHYFVMRSNRIKVGEVSSTGAFLMLDIIPEDIFACAPRPPCSSLTPCQAPSR